MTTFFFILFHFITAGLVGLIGSVILGVVATPSYYVPRRFLGRGPAIAAVVITCSFFSAAWTAFLLLWAVDGSPPYHAPLWAAYLVIIPLSLAPVATAYRSTQNVINARGLTDKNDDLFTAIGLTFWVQSAVGIWMFFSNSFLHWWRWLPWSH